MAVVGAFASAASERLDAAARAAVEASALAAPVVALAASDLALPAGVGGVTQEADLVSGAVAVDAVIARDPERAEVVAAAAAAVEAVEAVKAVEAVEAVEAVGEARDEVWDE